MTFNPGSSRSGRIGVEVTVSDGKATGTGLAFFSVQPAGSLPADLDPATHNAVAGETVGIDLAPYIHATGMQRPELVDVEQPENTAVSFSASDTALSFTATVPGTYHVPYTVRQGRMTSTGMVRFDVSPDSREAATPSLQTMSPCWMPMAPLWWSHWPTIRIRRVVSCRSLPFPRPRIVVFPRWCWTASASG